MRFSNRNSNVQTPEALCRDTDFQVFMGKPKGLAIWGLFSSRRHSSRGHPLSAGECVYSVCILFRAPLGAWRELWKNHPRGSSGS